ncbi:MAG: AMP-binding protein, partial [Byssovorax sp.]
MPLFTGGLPLLLPDQAARDGVRLKEILESGAVTVAQATPATWRMVMAAGWSQRRPLKILCGGEAMTPDLAERLVTQGDELWNMYGPTEATVWATTVRVRAGDRITVGRPLGNYRIHVLDRRLELVPFGIPGEIYIGGEGLSPGYLRRPDLDEHAFLPNPFGDADAPTLYRTGDLGRFLPDGRLECLGRTDHQVKIRGFRIELGEIDVTLQKLPGVRMAATVVREDTPGHPHLAAFLVPEKAPLSTASMRDTLGRWLPPYMVPQTLVWLQELPQSQSRKIDRPYLTRTSMEVIRTGYGGELAAVKATEGRVEAATGAARSLEEWLEQRCQSLLRTSGPLDRDLSLFALGLNSILVTALRVAIQDGLGIAMPLAELARGPSIPALARWISEQHPALPRCPWSAAAPEEEEHAPPPSPPQASDVHAPFPLTPIQEAYLTGRLLEAEADRVGCHIYLEIEERDLDVGRLCRAFQRLVDSHQALRTVVLPSGRQQVLEGPCRYQPDLVDLSTLGDDARAAALDALRARMDHRLYDPYTWPLFAVTIVRLDQRSSRIHLSIDNLFVDGSSLVILLEQWSRLYRRPTSSLRLPGLSFRDYCVALGARAQSPEMDGDLAYWLGRLERAPCGPSLPYLSRPDRAAGGGRRRRYSAEL